MSRTPTPQPYLAWTYAITTFASAFLLFQVQPLIAKYLTPWFGGSAAVWTTSMMFFIVALLLGYAYVYLITWYLTSRQQIIIHLGLIAVSWIALAFTTMRWQVPILPSADWQPTPGQTPVAHLLLLLTAAVGLPYGVLSTTSPLLQRWWGALRPDSPYKLYALSNAASLLALLSYPFLFEPLLSLPVQGRLWAAGFGVTTLLIVIATSLYSRAPRLTQRQDTAAASLTSHRWRLYALWLGLPALTSMLLIAGTNQLTQEIAATPFLWLLPLSLYLLSFTFVFSGMQYYPHAFGLLFLATAPFAVGAWLRGLPLDITSQVIMFSLAIFLGCSTCHEYLYQRRPTISHLPWFYVVIAAGSALGATVVSLIVPLIFSDHWEFPLIMIAATIVALVTVKPTLIRILGVRQQRLLSALLVLLLLITVGAALVIENTDTLARRRNFYGVVKVQEETSSTPSVTQRYMVNGHILHGGQVTSGEQELSPTTYYTESSGIARALAHHPKRQAHEPLRVGVLGLGTGTMAAFCTLPGDHFRFYEINPAVVELTREYFTYLQHCPGKTDIVLGDARLSLEQESHPQKFDLMVVDAFTDDAIPLHLLTREAVVLYERHLAPGGILAFNISNRHVNLRPVLKGHAETEALAGVIVDDNASGSEAGTPSVWVLLAREESTLEGVSHTSDASSLTSEPGRVYWTDTYSNLFRVLRTP